MYLNVSMLWLNGEDVVEGLRAVNIFFGDGKGVKNSVRGSTSWPGLALSNESKFMGC